MLQIATLQEHKKQAAAGGVERTTPQAQCAALQAENANLRAQLADVLQVHDQLVAAQTATKSLHHCGTRCAAAAPATIPMPLPQCGRVLSSTLTSMSALEASHAAQSHPIRATPAAQPEAASSTSAQPTSARSVESFNHATPRLAQSVRTDEESTAAGDGHVITASTRDMQFSVHGAGLHHERTATSSLAAAPVAVWPQLQVPHASHVSTDTSTEASTRQTCGGATAGRPAASLTSHDAPTTAVRAAVVGAMLPAHSTPSPRSGRTLLHSEEERAGEKAVYPVYNSAIEASEAFLARLGR